MENLYKILNCNETASVQELKKSYQVLALKYHPDKTTSCQSDHNKFIQITRAWTILRDPRLRKQFDTRWQERSLAQAYPIQDTVDFEEFEKIETCDAGVTNDSKEDKRTSVENVDGETCDKYGDNCDFTLENIEHSVEFHVCQKESHEITESEDLTEGGKGHSEKDELDLSNKQKENEIADVSELPSLAEDAISYTYSCRCGGNYILTDVDVKLKFDIVCCDTCSLSIQVIYDETDDNNDDDIEGT